MPRKKPPIPPVNKDGLLKSVVQDIFVDAIRFVIPNADTIFDFSRKIVFIDKELDMLVVGRKKMRGRIGDLVVRVFRKDGRLMFFIIHLELQAQRVNDFAHRMFVCNYRLRDRYNVPVVSLAIFVDDDPSFRPEVFSEDNIAGYGHSFRYLTYKMLEQDEEALKRSENVFALVVRAVKIALNRGKESDEWLMEAGKALALEMQRVKLPLKRRAVLLWFLRNYVSFQDPKNVLIFEKRIDSIIHKTKKMGVIEYMTQHVRQEERRVTRRKTNREKNTAFVTNLIQKTKHSTEEIADLAGVSVTFVNTIRKRLKAK